MKYTAETMCIRSQDNGRAGCFAQISAAVAGWEYLNMAARRLDQGHTWAEQTGSFEWVHVILGGKCHIYTGQGDFHEIGARETVFGGRPFALYLPRHTEFEIEALTDGFEIASCWVPTDEDHPAQLVRPSECAIELRGGDNASRQINSILPPGFGCHRLVCVEVYTPAGNWSSYPPHKHDVHWEDASGRLLEADLEEIYFYKIDKPEGYAYQRVYNDTRTIDALMMPQHHDMVLVPEGYHPVVSPPGYTIYYLNFLAGSAQSLANQDDPAYAWVKHSWGPLDPRLPLIK